MNHIRSDYDQNKLTIILPNDETKPINCSLCPGNENMTNLSIVSLVAKDGMLQRLQDSADNYIINWTIRIFESSNPVVSTKVDELYSDSPLYMEPAYGYHYIVVASSKHEETFATISIEQWSNIIVILQDRLRWLYTKKKITYVAIYINYRKIDTGETSIHPHINMVALSIIPPTIEKESQISHKIINDKGICPMCQIINDESNEERQILQTDSFIAFCPWSSSYPFEFCICPKKHITNFSQITQKEISDLALILRSTLGGMSKSIKNPSYDLIFHLSPEKKNNKQIHWHIEIYPLTKAVSGIERGYNIYLNNVHPEKAATILGNACRKELASLIGII